mmetsp:Transcript_35064/g.76740  ORF Transcript_35064/g.76740 Transcript_35064/m.76740 type:complete len:235 (+) Transcript_35064:107-811(+)
MRRGARQERRENRRENRQERREDRGPGAAVAVGAVTGALAGVAIHSARNGSRSPSPDNSDAPSEDDSGPKTFAMREKLLAFGDDFTINKMSRRRGRGKPAYYSNNKIFRARETFYLKSLEGENLYKIQDRVARLRDSMAIEDDDGNKVAEIKKRAVGVVRDNFVVKIRDDTNWQVHGSILEHEFTIKEDGREIVTVHKKWIAPVKDRYFIDVDGTDDVALALCVVIALETMTED